MSTQMMKAVQQHAFGGPEVLSYEDVPMPVLQAGEVLVQVHAVGVNPPDSYLRDGYQQLPPECGRGPLSLDPRDRSLRVVVARADDVQEVAVGDEVYAMARFPEGRGAAALTPSTLACRSATSLANPNPEPSAGCRGADVAPDRTAVHDRSRHEVANPHRPVPLAGKRVWSTARQGESVISPCSWRSGRAPR